MAESIFAKLGFNFDTNKFGDAQYLSVPAKLYLNSSPMLITTWQQNDIANGNIQMSNYYKNPLANDCALLSANASNIYVFANTISFSSASSSNVANLKNTASSLYTEILSFKSHTDNVSGYATMTSNTDTIPCLSTATSMGNHLLRIVSATDNIQNTTPMLGSMTSLFIGSEVNSNVAMVNTKLSILNSSVAPNGNCWLSDAQVISIKNDLDNFNTFINYRRTSDWNFFANSVTIIMDTMKLTSFSSVGNTQNNLIYNLIGTDRLKNNLNSDREAAAANSQNTALSAIFEEINKEIE